MSADTTDMALDVGLICQGWTPDPGGVESHTRDLAVALAAAGHHVHALCLDYGEGREPYTVTKHEVDGVSVTRMAYLYQDHRALADLVSNRRAEDVVLAWLAENPTDVVHVHHLSGFGLGALRAIREVGVPLVMTLHDYWPLCPRGQMMRPDGTLSPAPEPLACATCIAATWPHLLPSQGGEARVPGEAVVETDRDATAARTDFALASLRLPERLYTPSSAAREVYVRAGLERERIEVCENGISVEVLAAEVRERRARRAPRADGTLALGVLGTVLPSKGALELARAFLAADVPGLTLEIHGNLPSYHGDASYVDALRALAEANERVNLHGPYALADLPALLAGLDGVAAPSRWVEVFGLTVREASAAGLPVLVSDAGDLAAVAAGGAGVVVPLGEGERLDEEAWARALERFARDADARARMAAAQRRVRTAADMADQLVAGYRNAIAAESARTSGSAPQAPAAPTRRGFLRRLFGG